MVMSTQTLGNASKLMERSVLIDKINVYTVEGVVQVKYQTEQILVPHAMGYPALVQTTTLANAAESAVSNTYSIKVAQGTPLLAGMVVQVARCVQEPSLVGKKLLVDKVSANGAAVIRKAVASDYDIVNQEGKEEL